jgi:ribosomal protein L11 methyltransferase
VATEWFEVTIEAPGTHAEAIANYLIESGAPGVESQEREGGIAVIAYFRGAVPLDALARYCAAISGRDAGAFRTSVRHTSDEDWANQWKQYTRPQPIGKRLYVCPSWDMAVPADRVALVIDPGMAFGTGQHPTTRGCLELVDWATQRRPIEHALDVGTGSGILAIALAKLGAEVCAIDNDPVARGVAAQNAARNGVAHRLRIGESLDAATAQYDLVVANLYADLLAALAADLVTALAADGLLLISGFLQADETRLSETYEALGLRRQARREQESWVTLGFIRCAPER